MNARARILIAVSGAAIAAATAWGGNEGAAATRTAARRRVSESIRKLRRAGMAAPPSPRP